MRKLASKKVLNENIWDEFLNNGVKMLISTNSITYITRTLL